MNRIFLPIVALAFVSTAFASGNPTKTDEFALVGGYSPAEIDSEVVKVAEFAVKTHAQATGRDRSNSSKS